MNKAVIEVKNVSLDYGGFSALIDLNLAIPENTSVAIVGPNGAGKSTLFKILLGLISPTKGTVRICGEAPEAVPAHWLGYVPQVKTMNRSFPALAVELVYTGLSGRWPWRMKKLECAQAMEALEQVGAVHLAHRPLGHLSGGELQRVYLARSLVRRPKIVMLDEPATGIDAVGEADMYRLLEDYQATTGATSLIITHDWHAATHHADLVLLLNHHQISFGPPGVALGEKKLRQAFGHIGHTHALKFLVGSDG